jgi:uncharacterized protein (UPF0305 family)
MIDPINMNATQSQRRPVKEQVEEEKAAFNLDIIMKPVKRLSSKQIKKKANCRPSKGLVQAEPSFKFEKKGDVFICPVCKERSFEKAQSLGGHMSKVHPSQSADFTRKQLRRKEREPDR